MKIWFGKDKDIDVATPEKSVEEQLNEALSEIDFLAEQLKTPLKESRKKFRERYETIENNLNKRYSECFNSLEETQETLINQLDELNKLRFDYEVLYGELKGKELTLISDAQRDAYNIIHTAEAERDKITDDISKCKAEFEEEYKQKLENLNKRKSDVENESKDILEQIEKDTKILEGLEKQIYEKDKLNKHLSKTLLKKSLIVVLCAIFVLSLFMWSFRDTLFPVTTISSAVSSLLNNDFTEVSGDVVFTVNGEAVTKISLFDGVNKFRGEEYFTIGIGSDSNSFKWERYNKGDAEFIKVPYEPQYVLAKNRTEAGWHFDKDESQKLIMDVYYSAISGIRITEKNIVSEYDGGNVFSNFFIFIKNRFVPNRLTYTFNVNPENLKSVYGVIKSSPGYKSFVEENDYIKKCLKLSGSDEIDSLLTDTFILGNMEESMGKIQIEDGVVKNIGINFHGTNNNQDKISIYCTFSFSKIDRNKSYEKQIFMMNSMPYNEIYPRVDQDEFKDLESQGNIQENISTLKDLEDKGYDFSG